MLTQTQQELKALKAQIDTAGATNPQPGTQEFKALEVLVDKADGLAMKIQMEAKSSRLNQWLQESGGSAVLGTMPDGSWGPCPAARRCPVKALASKTPTATFPAT